MLVVLGIIGAVCVTSLVVGTVGRIAVAAVKDRVGRNKEDNSNQTYELDKEQAIKICEDFVVDMKLILNSDFKTMGKSKAASSTNDLVKLNANDEQYQTKIGMALKNKWANEVAGAEASVTNLITRLENGEEPLKVLESFPSLPTVEEFVNQNESLIGETVSKYTQYVHFLTEVEKICDKFPNKIGDIKREIFLNEIEGLTVDPDVSSSDIDGLLDVESQRIKSVLPKMEVKKDSIKITQKHIPNIRQLVESGKDIFLSDVNEMIRQKISAYPVSDEVKEMYVIECGIVWRNVCNSIFKTLNDDPNKTCEVDEFNFDSFFGKWWDTKIKKECDAKIDKFKNVTDKIGKLIDEVNKLNDPEIENVIAYSKQMLINLKKSCVSGIKYITFEKKADCVEFISSTILKRVLSNKGNVSGDENLVESIKKLSEYLNACASCGNEHVNDKLVSLNNCINDLLKKQNISYDLRK